MALFLAFLIFGLTICSFVCAMVGLFEKNKSEKTKYFSLTSLGSAIWGIGFGFLIIQKNPEAALLCRRIGMVGLFFFFVLGPKFFLELAQSPKWLRKILTIYSLAGIILYPFLIMEERQTFYVSNLGMSYTLTNDIWNTLYYAYIVIFTILCTIILIIMRKNAKYKRTKVLNTALWAFILITFMGSILDTLLPMLGVTAFPGSTLGQFIAIFVGFFTLLYEKKNTLTLQTVSNHIYHSIDLPIIVVNIENNIEFMSDYGYKFFEVEKNNLKNTKIKDLFVLDFDTEFLIKNYTNKECVVKNNNAYCNISIEKVRDSFKDIIGYIFIITDLTEKNKYINELQEAKDVAENAREEAELASKSKDNFLANMSHELRTPLNAIIGMNELIQNEEEKNKINEYSNQIDRSSKNLLSMIDELFDFSKIQSGKLDIIENEYSIIEVIKNVISSNKEYIQNKSLIYEINIEQNVPNILMGDEKRIKQCISNLLKNSIKYTNNGKISINVNAKNLNDKCDLTIEIIDSGIGIKKEEIEKLFISFKGLEETNNRNYEGIGIGLTIVKKLMLLMNGKFDIESEYHKGTKCSLHLPQIIVDSTLSGGYTEKNYLSKVCILNDNSMEVSVLKKVLQKEYVDIDLVSTISEELIKDNNYDHIFINYSNDNNLMKIDTDNVIYLIEDNQILENKNTLKKPINKTELINLIKKDKIETIKEVYCPNVKMLAVDDNKLNLVVLKGFLKKTGAQIDSCLSGAEALSLTEKNAYDIIFLDHMMPGMDGVETLKKIRTQNTVNSAVPILVVTANAVEGAKEYYIEQGFNDYISKPIDLDYLNLCLSKYLPKEKIEEKPKEE